MRHLVVALLCSSCALFDAPEVGECLNEADCEEGLICEEGACTVPEDPMALDASADGSTGGSDAAPDATQDAVADAGVDASDGSAPDVLDAEPPDAEKDAAPDAAEPLHCEHSTAQAVGVPAEFPPVLRHHAAWSGERFGLVWREKNARLGLDRHFFTCLDPTLPTPLAEQSLNALLLSETPLHHDQDPPFVVWHPGIEHFAVAWGERSPVEENPAGEVDEDSRHLSLALVAADCSEILESQRFRAFGEQVTEPRLLPEGGGWRALWRSRSTEDGVPDIYTSHGADFASLFPGTRLIEAGGAGALARNEGAGTLVVWTAWAEASASLDVNAASLADEGLGPRLPVADSEAPERSTALVSDPLGWAVAYTKRLTADPEPLDFEVYLHRLRGDGVARQEPLLLGRSAIENTEPDLAWAPELNSYGVVWRKRVDDVHSLRLTLIEKEGVEPVTSIAFSEAADFIHRYPVVTWTGDRWGVFWTKDGAGIFYGEASCF